MKCIIIEISLILLFATTLIFSNKYLLDEKHPERVCDQYKYSSVSDVPFMCLEYFKIK